MLCASVSKNYCITTFKRIHAKFNLILLSLHLWKPIKSHLEILCNARNCFKAFQKIGYIEFRIFWSISNNSKERCTCLTNILERIFHIVCLYDNCYSCLNMKRYKYANSYYGFTYACSRVFLKFDTKQILWWQKNDTYIFLIHEYCKIS